MRSKIEPALKAFGGATGATLTMRPFLSPRLTRSSSGRLGRTAPLPRNDDGADAGRRHAGAGDRAGRHVGIGERHFGGMHRAGHGFLDKAFQRASDASAPETRLAMS